MKNKEVYFILGFVLLIVSIFLINAALEKDSWHDADEILITIDGFTMTLQEAVEHNVLIYGANKDYTTELPNPGHDASEIWISVDGRERILETAISEEDFCGIYPKTYVSGPSLGQFADEIEVTIGEDTMSFQDAIDGRNFCREPSFWIVDGSGKVFRYLADGTYSGESWSTTTENANPWGITTDGEYFWITDTVDKKVYKYYMNGEYTGENWETTSPWGLNSPKAIASDKDFFWMVEKHDFSSYVHTYTLDGTLHETNLICFHNLYDCEHSAFPGISSNGDYLWIGYSFVYSGSSQYTGDSFYEYKIGWWYHNGEKTTTITSLVKTGRGAQISNTQALRINSLFTSNNNAWVLLSNFNGLVYKYNLDETDSEETWSLTGANSNPRGITSDMLVLGNLVKNGNFDSDTSWIKGGNWLISEGTAHLSSTSLNVLEQDIRAIAGQKYRLTYTVTLSTSGITPEVGGVEGSYQGLSGTYTEEITAIETGNLKFKGSGMSTIYLDNIIVESI